jgi:pyridoxine 4-dehydrogenase
VGYGDRMTETFLIGGEIEVHRLGFGTMRLTGEGIWGPPENPEECRATLRRAVELGVDFIDTADSYGPYVTEELIGETLAPYDGVHIATKAGLTRIGPDVNGAGPKVWPPVGRPEYLRQECLMSLRRLRLETIDLFQLHRIDPKVPREEQFGVLKELKDEGKIRHVGLSQVSVEEIVAARKIVEIVSVQNRYNLADQSDGDVLEYCEQEGIAFIPWAPMAQGDLTGPDSPVAKAAQSHDVSPGAVALAWLLHRSDVILPIPGTSKVTHLEANLKASELKLTEDELESLDATVEN